MSAEIASSLPAPDPPAPAKAATIVVSGPPVVSFAPARVAWWKAWGVVLPCVVALAAWLVHIGLKNQYPPLDPLANAAANYSGVLISLLVLSVLAAGLQAAWRWPRAVVRHYAPLVAASIAVLCVWELMTIKTDPHSQLGHFLPQLYFPPPSWVLQNLINDRSVLVGCVYHSLFLLITGYMAGVLSGIICGLLIGWWPGARYWGMPFLKIVGPIPAMTWLPVALAFFSPSEFLPAMSIIAFSVWFPVTMLTASGVSNVRVSYLDVARTLGARRGYLIFRVVIPAAMPSIFLGLFMGLVASFLALIAAEMLGVSSGLGWYWAKGRESQDYSQVYGALVLMAVFFSLIMTALFKLRDRVLVWQKGVIKW